MLDVPAPAHSARLSGSVSGTRFAVAGSLWPAPFPPSPPPPVVRFCSGISQVLRGCPTSHVRPSSAYVLRLPDASQGNCALGGLGISRFPSEVSAYVHGVSDRAGLWHTSRYRCTRWGLPLLLTASASRRKFLTRLNTRPALSPIISSAALASCSA